MNMQNRRLNLRDRIEAGLINTRRDNKLTSLMDTYTTTIRHNFAREIPGLGFTPANDCLRVLNLAYFDMLDLAIRNYSREGVFEEFIYYGYDLSNFYYICMKDKFYFDYDKLDSSKDVLTNGIAKTNEIIKKYLGENKSIEDLVAFDAVKYIVMDEKSIIYNDEVVTKALEEHKDKFNVIKDKIGEMFKNNSKVQFTGMDDCEFVECAEGEADVPAELQASFRFYNTTPMETDEFVNDIYYKLKDTFDVLYKDDFTLCFSNTDDHKTFTGSRVFSITIPVHKKITTGEKLDMFYDMLDRVNEILFK